MSDAPEKVIYDCNIHLQYLLNPTGPAGVCVHAAFVKQVELVVSYYLFDELREMPERATPRRLGVTSELIEDYLLELARTCTVVAHIPMVYEHPVDVDDSHYLNLAIATGAELIVSRDRHLLGLMDPRKSWSSDFRSRFSTIRILTAEAFVERLQARGLGNV